MKIDLDARYAEISKEIQAYNSGDPSANFQHILSLLLTVSVLFNRTIEKRFSDEIEASNERRLKANTELANTHPGLGLNWGTGLVCLQAIVLVGLTFTPARDIAQGISQIVGSIKGLNDESVQGKRVVMQHSVERIKMIGDDQLRGSQRHQSLIAELMSTIKQADSDEHNTASRIL